MPLNWIKSLMVCSSFLLKVAVAYTQDSAAYKILAMSFRTGDNEIFEINPVTGDAKNLSRSPSNERYPSYSHNQKYIAFNSDRDGTFNLYVMQADGSNVKQLTFEKAPVVTGMQTWTSNNEWIYFGVFGKGEPQMCRIHPDGSGFEMVAHGIDPAISPDGKRLVFAEATPDGHYVCMMDVLQKTKKRITNKPNKWAGVHASWSPDGRQIIYADQVGDALELFSCSKDGDNIKQLTSFGNGHAATSPSVSPDNRFITFRLSEEIFWANSDRMKKAYSEKRADLRPVWMMKIGGTDARIIQTLAFQTTIDGSKAPIALIK